MAAAFGEGFENTLDLNSAEDLYGGGNFTQGTGAAFGVAGGSLQGKFFQGGSTVSTWKFIPAIATNGVVTADPFWVVGFRVRANTPTSNLQVMKFMNGANLHCRLQMIQVGANDYRIAFMDAGGTERGTTGTLAAGTWYWIELKLTISNSGAWVLRQNEVNVGSGTHDLFGAGSATCDLIEINVQHVGGGGDLMDVDDFYFLAGAGGVNTDFLGDGTMERVEIDVAAGAGSASDWTAVGAATNREAVDDVAPDDDSSYVHTNANSKKDLYHVKDLVFATPGTPVKFLVRRITARLLSAGSRNIQLVQREGVTENNSASFAFTSTSYVEKALCQETDPIAGGEFTVANINAMQMGMVTVP